MMRAMFAMFARMFSSKNGDGRGSDDLGEQADELVTRENVDRQTSKIQSRAVMARLKLAEVERKLAPPVECVD